MIFDKIKSFFSKPKTKTPGVSSSGNTGVIARVFHRKGYGFITTDGDKTRIFVHFTDVEGKIKVGDKVEFSIEDTDKGPRAVKVRVIS